MLEFKINFKELGQLGLADKFIVAAYFGELCYQGPQVLFFKHDIDRDVQGPEKQPAFADAQQLALDNFNGLLQLQTRNPVVLLVFNHAVHHRDGAIVDPLPYNNAILVGEVVAPLSLLNVVYPKTLEVVSILLGVHPVPILQIVVPLPDVNIPVGVYHPPLPALLILLPIAIVPVIVFKEVGSLALHLAPHPIPRVLSYLGLLLLVVNPQRALPVLLVLVPHPLVLHSFLVDLDPKPLLHVPLPISLIAVGCLPIGPPPPLHLRLLLLGDPVNSRVHPPLPRLLLLLFPQHYN